MWEEIQTLILLEKIEETMSLNHQGFQFWYGPFSLTYILIHTRMLLAFLLTY
jgi:hypothetical protein